MPKLDASAEAEQKGCRGRSANATGELPDGGHATARTAYKIVGAKASGYDMAGSCGPSCTALSDMPCDNISRSCASYGFSPLIVIFLNLLGCKRADLFA